MAALTPEQVAELDPRNAPSLEDRLIRQSKFTRWGDERDYLSEMFDLIASMAEAIASLSDGRRPSA